MRLLSSTDIFKLKRQIEKEQCSRINKSNKYVVIKNAQKMAYFNYPHFYKKFNSKKIVELYCYEHKSEGIINKRCPHKDCFKVGYEPIYYNKCIVTIN